MAKIGYLVYCSSVESESDFGGNSRKQMTIINPLPEISLPYLPTAYSMSLAVGLADITNDFKSDVVHLVKIICEIKDGKRIFESPDMPLKLTEEQRKRVIRGVQLSVEMRNIIFEELGVLKTSVLYDGRIIGEHEIPVVKV